MLNFQSVINMNNPIKLIISALFILETFGCVDSKEKQSGEVIEIDFSNEEKDSNSLTTSLFECRKMVRLETTKESVFTNINRLIIFENQFYIFDLSSESILVFNDKGHFLFKIKPSGRGPGEYLQLSDFSIDIHKRQLVLLCDIPQSLMIYDLNGEFIAHKEMPEFNKSLSIGLNSMFFVRFVIEENENFICIYSNNECAEFLPIEDYIRDKMFYSFHPEIIRSNNTYFTKVYDSNIYELKEDSVRLKYSLNLSGKFVNTNIVKQNSNDDIQRICFDQNLIYRISDFRESNNYLTFCTSPFSYLVIYNKVKKQPKIYSKLYDPEIGLHLHNAMHIAHDGEGQDLVYIVPPEIFKNNVLSHIKEPNDSLDFYRETAENLKITDNPVLMIYTLK